MTQQEFEKEIELRLLDIRALYKKYNPNEFINGDGYLNMTVYTDSISANNRYWENDIKVDFHKSLE